jgi:hypothetical protein
VQADQLVDPAEALIGSWTCSERRSPPLRVRWTSPMTSSRSTRLVMAPEVTSVDRSSAVGVSEKQEVPDE